MLTAFGYCFLFYPGGLYMNTYSQLSIAELRALAKERKISGYSALRKQELIDALTASDNGSTIVDKERKWTITKSLWEPEETGDRVSYPEITVNKDNYTVVYKGKNIDMPPKELELLYFLMTNPNKVFTREQLLDHIWGYDYIGDTRTVDVHVKRLREKIKDTDSWSLATVWGVGYKFEVIKK